MGKIQALRGMKDILAPEVHKWQFIESISREVVAAFGFQEIRIPILEKTELFVRSIGEFTDVVEKEMYTFFDQSNESLTLRPEATVGVLRAYMEHRLYANPGPHKFFTIGPMFRHERPQKGRFRQFHQLDVEVLDDKGPQIDAELIVMLMHLLRRLGLRQLRLVINTLGCSICRPTFRQFLVVFLTNKQKIFCEDCQRRLNINPLRILDCKKEDCKKAILNAPCIFQYVCDDCQNHFRSVQHFLQLSEINFEINPFLVRGLDYYTRTTFEVVTDSQESQSAIAGGGRYDGLLEQLGGPTQGSIGFGVGLERLALLIKNKAEWQDRPEFFFVATGIKPRELAFFMTQALRTYYQDNGKGIWAEMSSEDKSIKAQMRKADKLGAKFVVFLSEHELKQGIARIKQMADGQQWDFKIHDLGQLIMKIDTENVSVRLRDELIKAFYAFLPFLMRS